MEPKKGKEGVSVKEIEAFTKKHRFEVFFCLAIVFACFFSFVFFGAGWGILFASIGGILGILMPAKIETIGKKIFNFALKQEQMTQLILGVVLLIVAIFLSPLIFLMLGLHGGKDIYNTASHIHSQSKKD
jgi:hypothetical protein